MSTRYHYDKHGNYKGCSSDQPPSEDWGGIICFILFILFAFGSCGSKRIETEQDRGGNALQPPSVTASANADSAP